MWQIIDDISEMVLDRGRYYRSLIRSNIWPIKSRHFRQPWSAFKVIRILHAFSNVIFRTVVQQLTGFQLRVRRKVPTLHYAIKFHPVCRRILVGLIPWKKPELVKVSRFLHLALLHLALPISVTETCEVCALMTIYVVTIVHLGLVHIFSRSGKECLVT